MRRLAEGATPAFKLARRGIVAATTAARLESAYALRPSRHCRGTTPAEPVWIINAYQLAIVVLVQPVAALRQWLFAINVPIGIFNILFCSFAAYMLAFLASPFWLPPLSPADRR